MKITNTVGFFELCQDAIKNKRNRQVNLNKLVPEIDPDGIHICAFSMIHNDVEVRTMWYVKIAGSMTPRELWLDVSFENFNRLKDHEPQEATK